MGIQINQFAKISPLVDRNGRLYNVNIDGSVESLTSSPEIFLKNNEIGIVYGENRIVTMYNGDIIDIGISIYTDDDFAKLVESNTDGSLDGKLYVVKRTTANNINVYDLMIINGTSAYNVSKDNLYASLFKVTDTNNSFNNSYIGVIPYKVMRITLRIKDNIKNTDNSVFKNYLSVYSGSNKLISIKCIDIEALRKNNENFETFECFTIFKDCLGDITVKTENENGTEIKTTNKNIEICVEYVLI